MPSLAAIPLVRGAARMVAATNGTADALLYLCGMGVRRATAAGCRVRM